MFDVIFVIIAGFTVAYVALMFLYSNMSAWQKRMFQVKSLTVELVFFFAPFGLAMLAQSTNAMLMSLGFGLGLSAFSASVKAKCKSKSDKYINKVMRDWDKMSKAEQRQYISKL